ncbi:hypothetical protein Pyn_35870 [Prunus yedoensis var. nudiflora]|uniref:F-box domain-containing protein n=1 Tax=Prunus yedoensis var. nudiflora TaxID=2094558 RepID=A0A314UC29_PRUYE|nr:hypothetical protein Pyn_35870 [Prunus yedoensis var. nudiflora]
MEEERVGQTFQFVQNKSMYNSADRISELPLEILASILSLLPLKEAVATSVLSRHWRHVWARTLQDKKSRRYVNWVNRAVEQHNGPNIESFRACFDLDRRFTSSIDKWIEFALKKRVQVFALDFVKIYGINKDAYAFPRKLLGLKKEFASNHYVGFKSLKEYNKDHVFPILSNLKQFELTADPDYEWGLSQLSSFMKAFPYLQRLTLRI